VASELDEIVIANASDVVNGDVSGADALLANPGADGISLREAIAATNNDPGAFAIRFAPTLRAATISLSVELPLLTGGGVSIDGDVDGDSKPDVNLLSGGSNIGLQIASSGNRLHALTLEGFDYGVVIEPPHDPFPSGRTFADNTVSGLVMRAIGTQGVLLDQTGLGNCTKLTSSAAPCAANNSWLNTTITGNMIEAGKSGIFFFVASTGDRVEGVTITDNRVRVVGMGNGPGINVMTAGDSTGAHISNVLIARNSIEGSPDIGIQVGAGGNRAQGGVLEGMRIIDNRVRLEPSGPGYCCEGIVVESGSDAPDLAIGPPLRYLDDNLVRDVLIRGNSIAGALPAGISLHAGFGGGGRRNQIQDVRIEDNAVESTQQAFGTYVVTGDGTPYEDRYAEGNRVSHLTILGNSFTIARGGIDIGPSTGTGASGIAVVGGGNFGRNNEISDIRIEGNVIESEDHGVVVIGGIGPTASGNVVAGVRIGENRIVGADDPVSVIPNRDGASGNTASVMGPPSPAPAVSASAASPSAPPGLADAWPLLAAATVAVALLAGLVGVAVRRRRG
jgi:hypothetical protein